MNGQTHGGKGSAQRPADLAKFEANWDAIFNKTSEKQADRDFCQDLTDKLVAGYDYTHHCNGCDQDLESCDMWQTEGQEMYDIGDQQVWEKYVIHHCEYCGSDDIEELVL